MFLFQTITCSNDPESHPFISKKELDYLKTEIGQLKRHSNLPSPPWKEIFTSVPIFVLMIAQITNDYVFYVLASDLPKYMREVLGFSIEEVGLYSSFPYAFKWISSILSGFLCDHLISRQYLTVTQARKLFASFASVLPSTCILLGLSSMSFCVQSASA